MNKVARASFPFLFAAIIFICAALLRAADLSARRSIHDHRTGKELTDAVADGTVYEFRTKVPGTTGWKTPAPLEGIWLESADHRTLIWLSTRSGIIATDTNPDCPPGTGSGGDCPPSTATCGGVPYDPVTEGCCGNQIYVLNSDCCVAGVKYSNGEPVSDCETCVDGVVTCAEVSFSVNPSYPICIGTTVAATVTAVGAPNCPVTITMPHSSDSASGLGEATLTHEVTETDATYGLEFNYQNDCSPYPGVYINGSIGPAVPPDCTIVEETYMADTPFPDGITICANSGPPYIDIAVTVTRIPSDVTYACPSGAATTNTGSVTYTDTYTRRYLNLGANTITFQDYRETTGSCSGLPPIQNIGDPHTGTIYYRDCLAELDAALDVCAADFEGWREACQGCFNPPDALTLPCMVACLATSEFTVLQCLANAFGEYESCKIQCGS